MGCFSVVPLVVMDGFFGDIDGDDDLDLLGEDAVASVVDGDGSEGFLVTAGASAAVAELVSARDLAVVAAVFCSACVGDVESGTDG